MRRTRLLGAVVAVAAAVVWAPRAATAQTDASPETSSDRSVETNASSSKPGIRFSASARGRFFRRNLNAAGANSTILAYASNFYPGFEVDARLFPFGPVAEGLAGVGLYADYNQGFETVTFMTEGGETRSVSLTHTEIEGGVVADTGEDLPAESSPARSQFQLKATTRHSRYVVGKNEKLPTMSMTALAVGGMLTEPLFGGPLAAQARLEVIPVAFFQQGGALFGETSYSRGFGSRLGLLYAISDRVSVVGGYRLRLHHSTFQGQGASGFENAEVFELVQGIDVGIQYGQ